MVGCRDSLLHPAHTGLLHAPPEALPGVLVMGTIDVALLYLLTRGLTWGERSRGLCKEIGYVTVFPATIVLILLLVTGLLNSVLDM